MRPILSRGFSVIQRGKRSNIAKILYNLSRIASRIKQGGVGRGMRRAARTAREVARRYGTPIYVWENGKVVAKDPNDDTKLDTKIGWILAVCPGFSGRFPQNQSWITVRILGFRSFKNAVICRLSVYRAIPSLNVH